MTKEVLINITGIHTDMIERGEEDEPVAVITPANYFQKNGKHYILYDEVAEGMPGVTKNKIKISGDNTIEIMKKGLTNTHMVFEKGKKHMTGYGTPFGQLVMGIHTKELHISETEEEIKASILYHLEVNEEAVAECRIKISITPKSAGMQV